MLLKDFFPNTDINFEKMIRGGGEFGFEFLLRTGKFKRVDGESPVFPRICKLAGHFVVVDAVDDANIYFRDPFDAVVKSISFAMVSDAKKELGMEENYNPYAEEEMVVSGVALIL